MDTSGIPPVAGIDEWPEEPDGFQDLKFGATKEDAEKLVTFEEYGITFDAWGMSPDDPYPTLGVTHFFFADTNIAASLAFHPTKGLHCIQGTFPTDQFGGLKSAFLKLYGTPHEVTSGVPEVPQEVLTNIPPEHLHLYQTKIESLLWCSANVYVYLLDRDFAQTNGHFLVASYLYMKHHVGGHKMVEKAMRKMRCTQDKYTPPDGWTQEPDDFNGLKLGMTKAEAEKHVSLGNCTVTTLETPGFPTRESFIYETTLNVAGLIMPGQVLFIEDRLINLGGKFDRPLWDVVKTAFIDLYGRPHVDEQREIFEQGLSRRLDWQGDRVQVTLLDFPDGTNFAGFCFQHTLKGATLQLAVTLRRTETPTKDTLVAQSSYARMDTRAGVPPQRRLRIPPPETVEIFVERTPSMLLLRLPDGTALNYSRSDQSQFSLKSTWHRGDDGRFVYDLDVGASMLSRIDFGDHMIGERLVSQPEGWFWLWNRWQTAPVLINPAREDAQQSLPGQKMSVARPPIPLSLPTCLYSAVLFTFMDQGEFGIDVDKLSQLAQAWIEREGFDFLKPALQGTEPLSSALDQLQPNTDFERQIVECLRETRLWSDWQVGPTADEEDYVSGSGKTARFSITSDSLPGPMSIYLVRKDVQKQQSLLGQWGRRVSQPPWPIPLTLPRRLYDAVLKTLREQTLFLNNTFIMGPAIAPNSTEDQLRSFVHHWIDSYGFDFLRPLLDDGPLSTGLDHLTTSTRVERQIVDCLRAALAL